MATPKNVEDVMVESTCLRKEVVFSEPPLIAGSIDDAGIRSARSDSFPDRPKA